MSKALPGGEDSVPNNADPIPSSGHHVGTSQRRQDLGRRGAQGLESMSYSAVK